MNYTSGTTGRPKGVRRALPGRRARGRWAGLRRDALPCSDLQPFDDNVHIVGSPLYHTAVLVFVGVRDPHRPHRRGDGQVVARADAAPDRQLPRDEHAHGADAVRAPARPPRGDAREVRRVVAAPHGARGGAVPARREAPDDRVVGSRDRRVLRRERRRRHARVREGVARAPGHGRAQVAGLGDRDPRRRRQRAAAQRDRHRLHAHARRATSSTTRTRRRPRRAAAASSSPSATSASSTTTAGCSCPTARPT